MFKKRLLLAMALTAVMGFAFAESTEILAKPSVAAAFDCSGGGLETFSNLGSSSSSYATRTWTGNNSVAWSATDARTDLDLTGDAIGLRTSTLKNTSTVTGGVGTLTFNYQRVFTGNSTLKVYVNGVQYGGDITVSSTSTTVYSQAINVAGNVVIEIKNSGNRTIVDDVAWTCYSAPVSGPELQLADAANTNVACGALAMDFGSVGVSTNSDAVFTVKNTGTSTLAVSALTLSNSTDFSIVSPSVPFNVSASGSQIVLVRFNSATAGNKTGTLTIASNDTDEASCVVDLEGTALARCVEPTIDTPVLTVDDVLATSASVDLAGVTADHFLAVITTTGSLSSNPVDGTTYTVGATLGGGTVVYNGAAANFSLTGLTELTEYTIFIFPYNDVECTDGPDYNTSVSIDETFTTPVAPCIGGNETFSNLGSSSSTYTTRTWTGDNSVAWSSTDSRTDQDLTGDAIAIRTGTLTNTTPVSGGMGTLTFNYKRVFTGNSTMKVFVNGVQYGGDITVSSDLTTVFSQVIDVAGPVTVEIRNSVNRIIVDDLSWNCYEAPDRPEIQLRDSEDALKACGSFDIDFGNVLVSTDADVTFTIENLGLQNLDVTAFTLSNPAYSVVSPATPFTVNPSSTQAVVVRFNSAVAGSASGSLEIESNDADETFCTINLDGNALNACTAPDDSLGSIHTSNITPTSVDIEIEDVTADGYLAVVSNSGSSITLTNGTVYEVGDIIGTYTVAYVGTSATFTIEDLNPESTYSINVYAYNSEGCIGGPVYTTGSFETEIDTEAAPCIGGSETFSNLGSSSSAYATRTWTGDNGVAWSSTDSRTDQDLTGDAIAIRTGTLTNTTAVSGGIGTLTFNYKRVFTGNSTMKVFVNGVQYGGDITVSADTTTLFSQVINVTGPVTVEVRNSENRIIVDDIAWDCYAGSGKQAANVGVIVSPNPNKGQFQLQLPSKGDSAVEIFDFSGNRIFSKDVSNGELIDLGKPNKGIYLVKITSNGVVENKKIIVE